MTHPDLAGLRVLVVEDEMLVAMLVEDVLQEELCTVVGPFSVLQEALAAAKHEALDMAVLDINLGDEKSFEVAELLAKRGIPFLVLTGYGVQALEDGLPEYRNWPVCGKPFKVAQLVAALRQLLPVA